MQTTGWTYDDYVRLPDDGKRYEIIDGELYVNPSPVPRHQEVVLNLAIALRLYFQEYGGGKVYISPLDVVLAEDGVVEPDLVVVKSERAAIVGDKNVKGVPNLVIEVLSDGTRRVDEGKKRTLYERSGIDEYWVVDVELELMKIHRRNGRTFDRAIEIDNDGGGIVTSPILPHLALDIREVFA